MAAAVGAQLVAQAVETPVAPIQIDGGLIAGNVPSGAKAWLPASLPDVRFHDLRSEYASRLVEKGIPLSQVRDLLGLVGFGRDYSLRYGL